MSRVIIKNLPKGVTEEKLRSHLGEGLLITDCSLKYTKQGVFRHFAFVGFKLEEEAQAVVKKFNRSFLNTSRISVELAKDLGDEFKPRAWSRYSHDSSTFQSKDKESDGKSQEKPLSEKDRKKKQKEKNDKKVEELFGELTNDPEFQEFLELHKSRDNKTTWGNDVMLPGKEASSQHRDVTSDSRSDKGAAPAPSDSENSDSDEERQQQTRPAAANAMTDLDYLKSKVSTNKEELEDSDDSNSSSESSSDDGESSADEGESSGSDTGSSSDEGSDSNDEDDEDSEGEDSGEESAESSHSGEKEEVKFLVKMKGLPVSIKEAQIKEFFKPIVPELIKIPRNAKGSKSFCIATVECSNKADQELAMGRNKNFIGPKRIFLHKSQVVEKPQKQSKPRAWEDKKYVAAEDGEEESIAESGRLYVRNLAYCCQPEDLEGAFGKFGPLAEVHIPIDKFTKKMKGFAFVTFMMPEHAVKAFTAMDGKVFQGRMLHILPARTAREQDPAADDKLTFKQRKEKKQKSQASSSHNWNSLFLGANAVADVMAEKYSTSKGRILDPTEKQSLGVRMALGETQIVAETRDFLLDNGVLLDSFSQAGGARSKTVVLAKNLPAGSTHDEIEHLFSKHGTLGRVLLPPSGVTAIVEFLEPTEAKSAFRNLAYTKFKHLPLYLEWAPSAVFRTPAAHAPDTSSLPQAPGKSSDAATRNAREPEAEKVEEEKETPTLPGFTLFVKNVNFETTEETLKEVFEKCGKVKAVSIAKKKDVKNPGSFLSMGYGFVEFAEKAGAQKALKTLQHKDVDGHALELKLSNRATVNKGEAKRKKVGGASKPSTKIVVRNIPFEAKAQEVRELFSVFGELKFCRLPKKAVSSGNHRGFGFVEFLTKNDAKRAFDTLCHSTHLYGRRLVLEWANTDETLDELRQKTAHYFFDGPPTKKLKKSKLVEDLKGGSL